MNSSPLLLLLCCFLCSMAHPSVDRNLTENQVIQDQTNKETFIPVPVNNDKVSKLSNSHNSPGDKKQSNNNSSSNNNNSNNNIDVRQTVEKKYFKETKPSVKVQNSDFKNISPPKQQLHPSDSSNYKVLDHPSHYDYDTGRKLFRYQSLGDVPTEDYISKIFRSELDLTQPGHDDELDYYNNNNNRNHYNHNKRYNNDDDYYNHNKRYNNNNHYNNNDNDDNDRYYGDHGYRAKYLKGRINSLAHLLGSKSGFETSKRFGDRRNLLDEYLGSVVLPRSSEPLVKSYYDVDNDGQEDLEDDDVMDSYDLANVMLKKSDSSYLDNYIDNAIRTGLLNPKMAENYKLNVMKEYEDMLSNHDDDGDEDGDDEEEEEDDDDINNDDDVGDEDGFPTISEDHRGHAGEGFAQHFPQVPEFKVSFERGLPDPHRHKVEKKFQLLKGYPLNDRQQELEEFASILRQVHLENDLENMARKHANRIN